MAKRGRPTVFKPEYSDLAHKFCLLGATNDDLARDVRGQPPHDRQLDRRRSRILGGRESGPRSRRRHRGRAALCARRGVQPPGGEDLPVRRRAAGGALHRALSARHDRPASSGCATAAARTGARRSSTSTMQRPTCWRSSMPPARGPAMSAAADYRHSRASTRRSAPSASIRWATSCTPSRGACPGTALAGESGPEPWQRDILERLGQGLLLFARARRCGWPSPRATASASRRWSPGSSCGRCRPCATRAASSRPTPRASSAPRPGPSSPSGTGWPSTAAGSSTPRRRSIRRCPATRRPGGSMPSPGRRTTPRRSPACTTRAAAPSPCSTRPRRSPSRSGTRSRAR